MKYFKREKFVVKCDHCGKVLDENEERYLISTQKWNKNAAGNSHLELINSRILCSKCYLEEED